MFKAFFFLRIFVLSVLTLCFIISGKSNYKDPAAERIMNNKLYEPLFLSVDEAWADSVLASLTVEEKIAQMIMIAAHADNDRQQIMHIAKIIENYKIGGIVFFKGSPSIQLENTKYYQSISRTPLFIAMDAEWGLGMRLDSTISYPYQMSLGAIRNNELIYRMGIDIGQQLKRLGVHINFAPVADINNNPQNPVINFRSFGENRLEIAVKARNYAKGLEDAGIIATVKHFPGHGDTDTDSHYSLPLIQHSYERLDSLELFPFKYCIDRGIPAVMVAHLNIPALDTMPDKASSLSEKVITDLLQKELDFKGLIFTDALSMKGVSAFHKAGELEVQAFMAGNDILLMPSDVSKTISSIKKELNRGNIDESEINRRVKKILMAKYWAGLNSLPELQSDSLLEELNHPVYKAFKNELIRNSLTVIKNNNSVLPLTDFGSLKLANIAIGAGKNEIFHKTLELYHPCKLFAVSEFASLPEFQKIKTELKDFNTLIISIQNSSQYPSKQFGITQQTIKFIKELRFDGRIVLCLFGNPYSLDLFSDLRNVDAIMIAYEDNEDVRYLTAQGIFAAFEINGRLPISINPQFPSLGSEIIPYEQTLSYGLAEEVLMSSDTLAQIDSIAFEAIREKVTPGCQILVARKGRVVYNKAFGYHTYDLKQKLKVTDLFDLASITKIAATLPLLMQLYEKGIFKLTDSISKYIPGCDTTNKAGLTFMDILAHQAGLQSWIPFYYSLLETPDTMKAILNHRASAEYPFKMANNIFFNKDIRLKKEVFRTSLSNEYPLQAAKSIYLNKSIKDSIYQMIMSSEIDTLPKYLYSDLGYYLFHQIIENVSGEFLYPLVYRNFYSQIGAYTLGYLPLNRFPENQIVPTENDKIFRKQLLHGYVHDPGAAMLGGIAGHAGLFSNANDLAKMMQIYLNGGTYAGKRFISDTVICKFSSSNFINNGNRRGLGFDKAETDPEKTGPSGKLASSSSYGHTGFTGTIAWMDPEYDLLYIFLSNRIYPDQFNQKLIDLNIRTRIHDVIYRSLTDVNFENGKTSY